MARSRTRKGRFEEVADGATAATRGLTEQSAAVLLDVALGSGPNG